MRIKPSDKPSKQLANPKNWIKGSSNYLDSTGPCCMMGAVRRYVGGSTEKFCVIRGKMEDKLCQSPFNWNDNPKRTHKEVIKFLKSFKL